MNISIVFTSQAEKAQPYVALAQQLREQVATLDNSFVVASSPDIVHVFGGFDKATQALLSKYRDMRIPTVLTACGALAAYTADKQTIDRSQLSRSRRHLLMLATAVHAVGNEEGAALAATAPKADVSVIANPVVTTTVSAKAMAAGFMQLYQEAIEKHEQAVNSEILKTITSATQAYVKGNKGKERIAAAAISGGSGDGMKEIKKVCAHLLYARYLNNRGLLTSQRQEELAQVLISTTYDEDCLAYLLPRMRLKTFTAQLLNLLQERQLLSEGFMPIDMARHPLKIKNV